MKNMDAKLLNSLASVIDSFSVPASLVSLKEETFLASNSQILRTYGLNFWEMLEVKIEGIDKEDLIPCFLRVVEDEPAVKLKISDRNKADFQLLPFSKDLVIIHEVAAWRGVTESVNETYGGNLIKGPDPFHLTYIYNLTADHWTFSNPDLLYSRGFVSSDVPGVKINWKDLIFEDDVPIFENILKKSDQNDEKFEVHYRMKRLNGDLVRVCDYCGFAKSGGTAPILVGGVISEGKSYDEMLVAERQVLVGRLVGGMIHDFRNLLGGIQNMLEWCISKEGEDNEVTSALQNTITYTDRATGLINGVLKICSGQEDEKIERIYISDVIADIEEMIRRIIPSSIELTIDVEPGLPAIFGKKNTISDMLLNLCINARDAMRTCGDKININVGLKTSIGESGGGHQFIALSVVDNGCGMSEQDCQTVFDAFYSTKETGAGLGLWMAREAVRAFNGKVNLKSELGKGTCFEIMFPIMDLQLHNECEVSKKEKVADSFYEFKLRSEKVALLIEDDPLIRLGVSSWLEQFGFEILTSDNGPEGLEKFIQNQEHIDVVIQDYVLPGMMGDELLKEFVQRKPRIPVIVTTGNTDAQKIEAFMSQGAYSVLAKPFKVEEMANLFKEIFSN